MWARQHVKSAVFVGSNRATDLLVQHAAAHVQVQSTHQGCVLLAWLEAQAHVPWSAEPSAAGESLHPASCPQVWQGRQRKLRLPRAAAATSQSHCLVSVPLLRAVPLSNPCSSMLSHDKVLRH